MARAPATTRRRAKARWGTSPLGRCHRPGPLFLQRVTHPFLYYRATSAHDAAQRLDGEGVVPIGGGTDLLVTVYEELVQPDLVVDLRTIPASDAVDELEDGSVRIGASARIAQ